MPATTLTPKRIFWQSRVYNVQCTMIINIILDMLSYKE